ncbi:MAG: amidohydrolase family protein [Pseudomonadota bacterium]
MKKPFGVLILLCLIAACSAAPTYKGEPDVAIRNVSVVDVGNASVTPDQTVLIEENRIVWVGSLDKGKSKDAVTTIDGNGGHLIPGLWDSHVHVFTDANEPGFALPLYVLNGVTGIRDMGALISLDEQNKIKRDVASGVRIGPTIVSAGALIDGPPGAWPNQMVAATPEEGRARVRAAKADGWSGVKAYSLLRSDVYKAIADEARTSGMALYGHIPETVTLDQAIHAGQRSISHFGRITQACSTQEVEMIAANAAALDADDNFATLMDVMAGHNQTVYDTWDEELCRDVAAHLAASDIAISPTLMVSDFYTFKDPSDDDPRMQTVPRSVRAQWKQADFRRRQMTNEMLDMAPKSIALDWRTFKLMHDAGVPIIAGTDAAWINPYLFHGATLHDELARYVEAGLTPADALATATTIPARIFDTGLYTGAIEPGAAADLVLLEDNPLTDVDATRTIQTVISGGRLYDKKALDALREKLEADADATAPQP